MTDSGNKSSLTPTV